MDKVDGNYLSQDGNDFPLDCETFDNIQKNSHMTEILGNIGGSKIFLTGCVKSGSSYSAGYVFVSTTAYPEGEVLRWPGGTVSDDTVYLSTSNTQVIANGTTYSAAYTTRVLTATNPGGGADSFNFTEFIHVSDNKPLYGEIKMFAGPIAKIPSNYKLCDGQAVNKEDYPLLYNVIGDMYNTAPKMNEKSGTVSNWAAPSSTQFRLPDLRARFIVGYSGTATNNSNTYSMANGGGDSAVTLTSSQSGMPQHKHGATASTGNESSHWHSFPGDDHIYNAFSITRYNSSSCSYAGTAGNWDWNSGDGGSSGWYKTQHNSGHNHSVSVSVNNADATNASSAHENRPPYYVMAYIIRVK